MERSVFVIGGLVGFLVGVLSFLVIQPSVTSLLLALAGLSLIFFILSLRSVYPMARLTALVGLMALLGLVRAGFTAHIPTADDLDYYHGQSVELEGLITEVDVRQDQVKYKLSVDSLLPEDLNDPLGPLAGESNLLITLNKYPRYDYGDRLKVRGDLQAPGTFEGFSYDNYLSRYGIYSVMYRPWATHISSGHGNDFWALMVRFQTLFQERINRIFPEPYASFEAGLLVGARKGIPDDLMEEFNTTGLTHIIAISGYNITIIIVFVMWALGFLPRRIRFWVAVAAIILFTLFVGASPAVVRASIMGILGLLALQHGRQSNIHITILMSASLMVLFNPKILWWDVGFQLSFAAVLGLIYVAPLFDRYSKILPETMGIREAIQMTLSAQVMALPIIIYNFERLSLIAPVANLLVAFAIPPAMLFGFIAVLLSFVFQSLSLVFGYITWGFLEYILQIIHLMSAVPYASVDLVGMKLWMLLVYYVGLITFLVLYSRRRPKSISTD